MTFLSAVSRRQKANALRQAGRQAPNACRSGALMDPADARPPRHRVAFFPDPFPLPWASDWGEDDEYGLWMALTLGDVRQVFRWIAPGRFLMGSPPDEPERL
jgi:hypothetical protein